jgi:hypothetical protein
LVLLLLVLQLTPRKLPQLTLLHTLLQSSKRVLPLTSLPLFLLPLLLPLLTLLLTQAAPEPKPLPLHVQVAAREVMTGACPCNIAVMWQPSGQTGVATGLLAGNWSWIEPHQFMKACFPQSRVF